MLTLLTMAALPAPAHATTWGMGIDSAGMSDPLFTALPIRHVRLVTAWDSVFTDRSRLDAWLSAARVRNLVPLVAFNHSDADICPAPCRAPSMTRYRRAFRAFRRRYPWVTEITPWNEANHGKQPTAHRPELAARYYGIVHDECARCTIVAADVLDSHNMLRWLRRFLAVARPRPRLIGLHNYADIDRLQSTHTDALLRAVHARVWLTETGGVVTLRAHSDVLPFQERHAATALDYLFDLVARRPRIERAYIYEWRRTEQFDLFDSGLLRSDGTPRPGYYVVRGRLARRQ